MLPKEVETTKLYKMNTCREHLKHLQGVIWNGKNISQTIYEATAAPRSCLWGTLSAQQALPAQPPQVVSTATATMMFQLGRSEKWSDSVPASRV